MASPRRKIRFQEPIVFRKGFERPDTAARAGLSDPEAEQPNVGPGVDDCVTEAGDNRDAPVRDLPEPSYPS